MFLKRIKNRLYDDRQRAYAPRGQTVVDSRDLMQLIDHFEQLESEARASHADKTKSVPVRQRLALTIEEIWHNNGKQADQIMYVFTEVLTDLLKKKQREIIK